MYFIMHSSSFKGACGLEGYRDQLKCVMLYTQDVQPSGLICSLTMHNKSSVIRYFKLLLVLCNITFTTLLA